MTEIQRFPCGARRVVSVDVPDAEGALGEIVIAGFRLRSLIGTDAGGARVYAATNEETGAAATVRLAAAGRRRPPAGDSPPTPRPSPGCATRTRRQVLAHGDAPEGRYLVTEEVVGRELDDIIGPEGLSPMRAVKLLGDVADALDQRARRRTAAPRRAPVGDDRREPSRRARPADVVRGRPRPRGDPGLRRAGAVRLARGGPRRARDRGIRRLLACLRPLRMPDRPAAVRPRPAGRARGPRRPTSFPPRPPTGRRSHPALGALLARGLAQDPAERPGSRRRADRRRRPRGVRLASSRAGTNP